MGASNALVATLLTMAGQRNVLTIPRAFVHFTKSLEAAMLLNQLLYWIPRGHDDGSIYKSDKEWQEELCLSRYAVRQARECLVAMGFLTTKVHRARGAPTVHYFLDYDALVDCWTEWLRTDDRLSEIEQSDCLKSNNPMSEIEQSDRPKSDNEIVRFQTNIKEHEIPHEIPPPPATKSDESALNGGGGGGNDLTETEQLLLHFRPEPFSVAAAHEFRHLPPDVVRAELERARSSRSGPGALVKRWRKVPPTDPPPTQAAPNLPPAPTLAPGVPAAQLREWRDKHEKGSSI